MADFCKECSIENFNADYGDLLGLCQDGEYAWVICEGCADHQRWPYVLVDSEGKRDRKKETEYLKELTEAAKLAESKPALDRRK